LGPAYNFQTHALVQTEPKGVLATGILPGTDAAFAISGIGVSLDFDTRDHVNFPGSGTFLRAQWLYYTKSIGSDFNFVRYSIDLRKYYTIFSSDVLAFQSTWTHVTNSAPLLLYPVLGDERLRGFAARYWDLNAFTLQTEYRKTVWGRVGLAVFAGIGDVTDRLHSLELRTIKFGVGLGLRYMVLPEAKFNLRVDIGFGNFDNSSLSFLAGEAF
jgi:outer membrane protein assembly factor BamA